MPPPWIVYSWPPLLWQASRSPHLHLNHVGTSIVTHGSASSPSAGQTLWTCAGASSSGGVAWDWVEMQDGVVAMADPMALVTNLKFVDDDGEAIDSFEATLRLHHLVHSLPWQAEVRRALVSEDATV